MSNVWIDRSKIKKIDFKVFIGGMTGADVYSKYKPDYLMNLALYDPVSAINITRMEDENKKSGYYFSNEGIGIMGDNELVWVSSDEAFKNNSIRDYVSGSPTLVKDSQIDIQWGNKYSPYIDAVHRRSFLGFSDKYLVLCTSDNLISIKTEASIAKNNLFCKYAINCDGGGSSHLQKGKETLRESDRKNVSWILVYLDRLFEFIEIVKKQLGKDYIYGADGQIFTYEMLQDYMKWFGEDHYIFKTYSAIPSSTNDVPDFDCSGLFVYTFRTMGLISLKTDYTALGLYTEVCDKINKKDLKNGDLVFRGDPINHVGMFLDGKVFHAKGTKYGVVITDEINTFTKYGRVKFFK